jgi:hypothetical protein
MIVIAAPVIVKKHLRGQTRVVSVTYCLSEQQLARWMWRRSMRASAASMIWLGVVGIGVVWSGTGWAQFFGFILLTWAALVPISTRRVVIDTIQQERDSTKPITVEFDQDGLKFVRPNYKGDVAWAYYRILREDKEFFELATSAGRSAHATLVPKHAFASDEERNAFRRFAEQGRTKAH